MASSAAAGEAALARLLGISPAIQEIKKHIREIAPTPVAVLILGETGTGKELCAEAIQRLSGLEPYIAVNCASIPEALIDTELFGHVRGAFTGADRDRAGLIARADGGVLFLDELAEVSPTVQAKLLRTLQSGEYRPVGAVDVRYSRFRILAATSGDLDRVILSGRLRPDLVHRLGALRIVLPSLRDRPEDIPLLVDEFLRLHRNRYPGGPSSMAHEALHLLADRAWPGNVRELRNVVEAAAALAWGREVVRAAEVLRVLRPTGPFRSPVAKMPSLAEVLHRTEQRALREALQVTNGNRGKAATLLGISEATLYRKLGSRKREVD